MASEIKSERQSRLAGLKVQRYNRRTKSCFTVYDGIAANMDTSGGRWQVVCDKHGSILSVATRKQAERDAAQPEQFCEQCRAKVEAAPKKPPKVDIYVGDDAFQKARHMARYSHKDWFVWIDKDEKRYAARATARTCKMAMLASGTQKNFYRVYPDGQTWVSGSWKGAVIWLHNFKWL